MGFGGFLFRLQPARSEPWILATLNGEAKDKSKKDVTKQVGVQVLRFLFALG